MLSSAPILLALLLSCATARKPTELPFAEWLDAWHARRGFSGVVLVARGSELLFVEGRGQADPAARIPNGADTRFDVGSIAKPFLATTVLRLAEKDVLDLDAPVATYVEELTSTPAGATNLRQLLGHTAGLIDSSDVPDYYERARAGSFESAAMIEVVRTAPLRFEPGSDFAYSNLGYFLAAVAVERATGSPYSDVLVREVVEPARLTGLTWNDVAAPVENRAVGSERAFDGMLTIAPLVSARSDLGSGDVLCRALDLLRFERALTSGDLLPERELDEMFRDQVPGHAAAAADADLARGYGLGWEVYRTRAPDGSVRQTQGHGGLTYGFVAVMERDPHGDTFFAVLSNVRPSDDVLNNVPPPDIRRMQSDLRRMLWGQEVAFPRRCLARTFVRQYDDQGLETALVTVERLREQAPDEYEFDPNAFMLAAYELSSSDDSIRLIEYALEEAPETWLLLEALGDFLAEAGRPEEALAAYRRAATLQPERDYLRERIQALSGARDR